jgi:S1-C subfamily serine protease
MKLKNRIVVGATLIMVGAIGVALAGVGSRDIGGELLKNVSPSVFILTGINNESSGGTGFVLNSPAGPVTITNEHVCELGVKDMYMTAHMDDGRTRVLRILKISKKTDLCMLEAPKDVSPLSTADFFSKYERIHVIGHPLLSPNTHNEGHAVTKERIIIPSLDTPPEQCVGERYQIEEVDTIFLGKMKVCFKSTVGIHTSVVIYPGNSGSPALNDSGNVVGVWFAGSSRTNFGAFVPLEDLVEFIR